VDVKGKINEQKPLALDITKITINTKNTKIWSAFKLAIY